MKKSLFETILSFLLGISWAFLILGSALTFKTFLDFGLFAALFFYYYLYLCYTVLYSYARDDEPV